MDNIWQFDGSIKSMPDSELINKSVALVGYENIVLSEKPYSVFLKKQGMKIGFGAIGKGYAADVAKSLLVGLGVESGIINASGDMNAWGKKPDGNPWQVAITNPMDKSKSYGKLSIKNRAVVSSGNYEKFITLDGERYSHIINPKTGIPAKGIASVTVFAPKAELADALATAVFVMGVETGINRINQMNGIDCIIVDDTGKLFYSNKITLDHD